MRMLPIPVVLDDWRTVDVAASVGAATPDVLGTRDLSALQRAADAALYDGKHSGRAIRRHGRAHHPAVHQRPQGRPSRHGRVGTGRMSTLPLPEGGWIRGITVGQPWAACILAGKSPENRPRTWSWRGWVLLHAGKAKPQPAALRVCGLRQRDHPPEPHSQLV
ncbi:hypothetical protein [Streptomyces yangpuensis]|uniref:hypothetical protein n=1 Tax=Streptomyces yangpuensis TaxID=1648182 RepID=UPI00382C6A5D